MNILFSPIGGTDPISKSFLDKEKKESVYTDGSMLHILRYYPIDKIYLYMSKEILDNENNDYRYTKSINNLCEKLSKNIEIAEIIKRPELTEVQEYDYFYEDFTKELRRIYDIESKNLKQPQNSQEQDEIKIYLNISSGTPAMKSALLVIQHLGEHDYIPVQVSTPVKKSNKEISKYPYEEYTDNNSDDNPDKYYRKNSDNKWIITKGTDEEQKVKFSDENPKGRCQEVKSDSLLKIKYIEIIKELVKKYEYDAALEIAEKIQSTDKKKYTNLIKIGKFRLLLDFNSINNLLNSYNLKNNSIYKVPLDKKIPNNEDKFNTIEYFMSIAVKVEKKQYADFIRSITPFILHLFNLIILKLKKINILNEYSINSGNKETLSNELNSMLNNAFKNGFKYESYIPSEALYRIIFNISDDQKLKDTVFEIRKIEKGIRNIAAHDIVSITDSIIGNKSGLSINEAEKKEPSPYSHKIIDLFIEALSYTDIDMSFIDLDRNKQNKYIPYKRMNEEIIKALE